MKRVLGFLFGVVATLWMAAPAAAWTLNDSEEPGSVLVFPKFEVGTVFTPDQGTLPRTLFSISVICPTGSQCAQTGQTVFIRAHWVCPPSKEVVGDTTCAEINFNLKTTVFGTLVFNTENIPPSNASVPAPPCNEEGFLIAWVTDETGQPIKFDGLIGHEVHRDFDTTAHALNALPIQAGENLNTFDPTAPDGTLHFDGVYYRMVTGTIFGNLRYDSNDSTVQPIETSMTLLTLDVVSNAPNPTTDVGLNFYNENEQVISTAAHFTCWEEIEPTNLDVSLVASNPNWTARGLVQSTYATQNGSPATVVGFIETKEGFTTTVDVPALPVNICGLVTIPVPPVCITFLFTTLCTTPDPVSQFTCLPGTAFPPAVLVPGNRQYAYPLLNNSDPVATTFVPN